MTEIAKRSPIIMGQDDERWTIGQALRHISDAACASRVDVALDLELENGYLIGENKVASTAIPYDQDTTAKSLIKTSGVGTVYSMLKVQQPTTPTRTVSGIYWNPDLGVIQRATQHELCSQGERGPITYSEANQVAPVAVLDMLREALQYADALEQPLPEWEPEPGNRNDEGLFLVKSERIVRLYAKLIGMVGRAMADFVPQKGNKLDVSLHAAFGSPGAMHRVPGKRQGLGVFACNSALQRSETFTVRFEPSGDSNDPDHCFMDRCSLETRDDRSGTTVVTNELLVPRGDEVGVLKRQVIGDDVVTSEDERVNGHKSVEEVLASVLRLAST